MYRICTICVMYIHVLLYARTFWMQLILHVFNHILLSWLIFAFCNTLYPKSYHRCRCASPTYVLWHQNLFQSKQLDIYIMHDFNLGINSHLFIPSFNGLHLCSFCTMSIVKPATCAALIPWIDSEITAQRMIFSKLHVIQYLRLLFISGYLAKQ